MADSTTQGQTTRAEAKNPTTRRFIDGLLRLEKESENGALLNVFSESCSVGNAQIDRTLHGKSGAEEFWRDYRDTFEQIESRFHRITETDGIAVLEWTSIGILKTGKPIEYKGVSVLSIRDGEVIDFMAYFDSRHFTTHVHTSV